MRYTSKAVITFFIFMILGIVALNFNPILIHLFTKAHGLSVSYNDLKGNVFKRISFKELKISDEKMGAALVSGYAELRPVWTISSIKDPAIDFDLYDVSFMKKGPQAAGTYSSLSDLVLIPFANRWIYKNIKGKLRFLKGKVHIEDFTASSDHIRFSLRGDVTYENTVDLELVIYLREDFVKDIPEALSEVVLVEEPNGWRSLSVRLSGDYKSPAIALSGRLFRLNVKNIAEGS